MQLRKTLYYLLLTGVVVGMFTLGQTTRNVVEAGGFGPAPYTAGGTILATGSGGAVGVSGPISLTGPVSITGQLSTTLGVSAATGVFSGAVSATGVVSATGGFSTPLGISAATGLFSGTVGVTGAVSLTGAVTTAGGVTSTTTVSNGTAIAGTANGNGVGVQGTGSNSGGDGVKGVAGNNGGSYAIWGSASAGTSGAAALFEHTVSSHTLPVVTINGDASAPVAPHLAFNVMNANPSAAGAAGQMAVVTGGIPRMQPAASVWNAFANAGMLATAAAAGTNQATATALTAGSDFYTITAADGAKGITLTQAAAGTCFRVMSQVTGATNTLLVYGHNSDNDTINGAAADAAYVQMAGTSLTYCTADGTAWFTY